MRMLTLDTDASQSMGRSRQKTPLTVRAAEGPLAVGLPIRAVGRCFLASET